MQINTIQRRPRGLFSNSNLLIKSFFRSSMSQEKLSGLDVLSIENDRAQSLDFRKVIAYNSLSAQKQHRKFSIKLRLHDWQGCRNRQICFFDW